MFARSAWRCEPDAARKTPLVKLTRRVPVSYHIALGTAAFRNATAWPTQPATLPTHTTGTFDGRFARRACQHAPFAVNCLNAVGYPGGISYVRFMPALKTRPLVVLPRRAILPTIEIASAAIGSPSRSLAVKDRPRAVLGIIFSSDRSCWRGLSGRATDPRSRPQKPYPLCISRHFRQIEPPRRSKDPRLAPSRGWRRRN